MPQIFMIAGPNGAGKTTSAINLLPDIIHCQEYINADSIATALSPYKLESIAFKAGKSIVVCRDGKIVHIPPEEIEIPEEFKDILEK